MNTSTMARIETPIPIQKGPRIYLRELRPEDVTEQYVRWMNDEQIIRFLESRFQTYSREDLLEYVEEKRKDANTAFFAIALTKGGRHVGNIKLGPVNWIHRTADVGILIGEKACHGKGYATEAIRLIAEYAFKELNLHKLTAGCYEKNVGAVNSFKKSGFLIEGIRKQHVWFRGDFIDLVQFGLVNPEY